MSGADRIVRGIMIGGAVGAFGVIFGLTESLLLSVGAGMVMGALAGWTRARMDRRLRK
ncbi:MAG: hypothetical protein LBO77_06655 [Desulfovibrio sp.]|nr:hypothetical protein [Desulfovibrio sp.]